MDSLGYPEYPRCTRILRHRGLIISGHPRIVQDTLSIFGVRGYSDIGVDHVWASMDSLGYPEYPRCTRILRHRGLIISGHPQIVQDTLSIFGVRGYSDIGVDHGWASMDSLGYPEYPRCTGILRHRG